MDLRSYYQQVRDADETLIGAHIVMVSLTTPEGGKAGVKTEVARAIAAKLIVEQRARVATEQESSEFHQANKDAKEKYDAQQAVQRLQVMVIPSSDIGKQKERE